MRSLLLLVLTLMTGCEASSEAQGCAQRCNPSNCNYCETNGKCQSSSVEKLIHSWWPQTSFRFNKCCLKPFHQTAYPTAKTTIPCHVPDAESVKSWHKFLFMKKKGNICEDISSKGKFRFTETSHGFNLSISNVSSEDGGVYWCRLRLKCGACQIVFREINLDIQRITSFTRSKTVGETFSYWCDYTNRSAPIKKFICKGEDPSVCQRVVSTAKKNNGRFSLHEDINRMRITVTVKYLMADDAGTYWCGAESSDPQRSNPFFHRLTVTVEDSSSIGVIIAVTCVAVLVLIFAFIFYKWFQASKEKNKNTRDEGAQNNNEDLGYAEIHESPQRPDPETAPMTVYVTANFPTNIFASMDRSEAQNISAEVSGNTYYNVWGCDHGPIYSTPSHPPSFLEDSLYSTVTNPQQY